jgi:DNA-binding protein HU-beta
MGKMTKTEMLSALSEVTGLSKKDVKTLLDAMTEMAYTEVKKNGEFSLSGLGKLVKVNRKAREGRNPATGEAIKIPAKTVLNSVC